MQERGFTLLEIVAVVLILAIVGWTATLYTGSAASQMALESAAREVAEALRFARSEALRVGAERALKVKPATHEIQVFEPELGGGSISVKSTLLHPLSKHPYDLSLRDLPSCSRVEISAAVNPFGYQGLAGNRNQVVFDASGTPVFVAGGVRYLLSSGQVILRLDGAQRAVGLMGNGRVTVQ